MILGVVLAAGACGPAFSCPPARKLPKAPGISSGVYTNIDDETETFEIDRHAGIATRTFVASDGTTTVVRYRITEAKYDGESPHE